MVQYERHHRDAGDRRTQDCANRPFDHRIHTFLKLKAKCHNSLFQLLDTGFVIVDARVHESAYSLNSCMDRRSSVDSLLA
jgi:hypothetical protein